MKNESLPVSLVIPTYNRVQKLYRLLRSLDCSRTFPEEIIIIDDNSKDSTKKLLKRWNKLERPFKKKVILKKTNRGPANSRNLGIKKSINNFIAFLDDDVIVENDWIYYISKTLLNSKDKNLAGVGGAVRSIRNDIISQYYVEHRILEAPRLLNYLPTLNCCFKREVLMVIGGFNENFLFAGGEDTELCLKLKNQGYHFEKEKRAIVYHDFSPNLVKFCKRWIRYGKGTQLAIESLRRGE